MMRVPGVCCALLLWCSAFAQQPPAQKAAIEGRVVNAVSGDPVRRANLTLSRTGSKDEPLTAQSDENGRFSFRGLDTGSWRLSAQRNGYLPLAYGATAGQPSGIGLRVASGQSLDNLTFRLLPVAVLAGRVVDDAGEPMPNLAIVAYRSGYRNGQRRWISSGGVQTNDRGEFRIGNLRAGRYLLGATDLNIGIGLAGVSTDTLTEKPDSGFATTWYGNTVDRTQASIVELTAGEDRRGTDIRMIKTPVVRVRGRISGGSDGAQTIVMLVARSDGEITLPGGLGVIQQSAGTFEIRNVLPGPYLLAARSATDPAILGAMPIEVGARHLENIELKLGQNFPVSGTVTLIGGKLAELSDMTVRLDMAEFSLPDPPSSKPGPDGGIVLANVIAGRYRVGVSGLPEDTYVKSIRMGGRETLLAPVDIQAGSGKLEVVVSRTAARVECELQDAAGARLPGAVVALIPESGDERYYRNAVANSEGMAELDRIAPGKYKLLAWQDIENGMWQDREFVKTLDRIAVPVALEEKARLKTTLKVVPAGGVAR